MTIRRRIFFTYLVLITIVLLYLSISFYGQNIRVRVHSDMISILELKNSWSEIQVALNDLLVHWDDGQSYRRLLDSRRAFETQLTDTTRSITNRYYYPAELKNLFHNLTTVWTRADEHLAHIETVVEHEDFSGVEAAVQRQTGLQRVSLAWLELTEEDTLDSRRLAHTIQLLMGEVEFFPIYRDTVDHMFEVILESAGFIQHRIVLINRLLWGLFFVAFILACIAIALRFSHSLSQPIIKIARRLLDFTGQTGADHMEDEDDEVQVLFHTVDHMINHYTDLSQRAGQLARGEIDQKTTQFSQSGVVGRSIDQIAEYLRELAQTSGWIRDGEYGSRIRERSENDVIAHTFNVMSGVIHEKITTLRNMFEAVDEAVLVIDENGQTLEANSRFLALFGYSVDGSTSKPLTDITGQLKSLTQQSLTGQTVTDHYVNLRSLHQREIPVRINTRVLRGNDDGLSQVMFLIANESWRAKAKRERERLKAQATVAELKALRAQINPHFFFNTLNTIAYLIETDSEIAVETVEKLSELFRYTLAATTRDRVQLEDELVHVGHLLDIERLRYRDRLRVTFEIDATIRELTLPPMLLQPLVENAVRYGGDRDGSVRLYVRAYRDGNVMKVAVADEGGSEIDFERLLSTSGTGIRNVNHRLKTLYGRTLVFRRNTPQGLVAEVHIPT